MLYLTFSIFPKILKVKEQSSHLMVWRTELALINMSVMVDADGITEENRIKRDIYKQFFLIFSGVKEQSNIDCFLE